jgi:hypothetical protein
MKMFEAFWKIPMTRIAFDADANRGTDRVHLSEQAVGDFLLDERHIVAVRARRG